jgi:hypothetical protein
MQTVITRYSKKEIVEAVKELERRGFVRKSEIVRVSMDGKAFKRDWKVPEFINNFQCVKYMCRMER